MTHPLDKYTAQEAARQRDIRERGYRGPLGPINSFFLPHTDYNPCQDLDGTAAVAFLEGLGLEVVAHGDKGTHGYALTDCGWYLSTNGHCSHEEPQYLA